MTVRWIGFMLLSCAAATPGHALLVSARRAPARIVPRLLAGQPSAHRSRDLHPHPHIVVRKAA